MGEVRVFGCDAELVRRLPVKQLIRMDWGFESLRTHSRKVRLYGFRNGILPGGGGCRVDFHPNARHPVVRHDG